MVAGELTLAIGHKGGLMGAVLTHKIHQIVKRVALDVEFASRPGFQQVGQIGHIVGSDVARVGAWVYRDALGPRLQARLCGPRHAGDA